MASAIEAAQLGKRYRLGTENAGYDTLREAVTRTLRRQRFRADFVWALRDVSFEIDEGEAVGVIGSNGAGKSTLLKVLARITDPTRGEARTRGRVAALLDVSTGLHPELTGRENIFLMGVILGMRRREIAARFDEIVEFSGIEAFLETPVKRFSTGMRLRLGFSVAAHLRPPIVVVDEVLAVGDAEFRERCLEKMRALGGEGRTVLFVSHDLGAVTRLCQRALWIESGLVRDDGPASRLVADYLQASTGLPLHRELQPDAASVVSVTDVVVKDSSGRVLTAPRRDQAWTFEFGFTVGEHVPGLDSSVWILDESGALVIHDVHSERRAATQPPERAGRYRVQVAVPALLAAKRYAVGIWLGTDHETFFDGEVIDLTVAPRPEDRMVSTERRRQVQPELEWTIEWSPLS